VSVVGLSLGLLAILASGERMLAWAGLPPGRGFDRLGLAFAMGLVGLTVLPFWLNLLGLPLSPSLALTLGGAGLLLAGGNLARTGFGLRRGPGPTGPGVGRWFGLVTVLFVALATARTLWEPLTGWDARALWGLYTGLLYHEQSVSGPGFTDPERCLQLTNYPLLVPLARWFLAAWMGGLEDQVSLALFPVCYVAMLAVVHGRLARTLPGPVPSLLLALLASVPVFWRAGDGSVASGYAEVPLALLSAALAVCLLEGRACQQVAWFRVAAWMGVGMVFTKRGGVLLVLLAFALLAAVEPRRARATARAALVCALLSLPWWLHQATLTHLSVFRPQNYAVRLYRVAIEQAGWAASAPDLAWRALQQTFLDLGAWSLLWWVVLVSALCTGHRAPARRWLLLMMLLYVGGTWLFLVRGQVPLEVLGGTNWARYLMPIAPWAVLYLGTGLEPSATEPLEPESSTTEESGPEFSAPEPQP